MKKILLLTLTLLAGTLYSQNMPRLTVTQNEHWQFIRQDVAGAEAPGFDDSKWQHITIPHTWNAEDVLDSEPGYYRGIGWYRKNMILDRTYKNKKVYLYFEAAFQDATVYVNGVPAGSHKGGYTAFCFDITDKLIWKNDVSENTIAVKLDSKPDKDIPPLTADFAFYGGIYRDVYLVASNEVHFEMLNHASKGIFIQTPQVSALSGNVNVRSELVNDSRKDVRLEVRNTVTDAAGTVVSAVAKQVKLKPGAHQSILQNEIVLKTPHLWSPSDPYLYKINTQIVDQATKQVVDEMENPLGFRWFRFDADSGFFLNGRHVKLNGTCRHQDYLGMGNAVPDEFQVRDVKLLKEMGANFVRMSHYPYDRSFVEACNRYGIIAWMEIPIVNEITASREFFTNCQQMELDLVRQYYNNPAVLMWGYMNEVMMYIKNQPTEELKKLHTEKTVELAKLIDSTIRAEDPYRVTVMAIDYTPGIYNNSGMADVPMVLGWNLYFGWYHDTAEDFGKFMNEQHQKYPHRKMLISEYGAGSLPSLHSDVPKRYDHSMEWHQQHMESYFRQINDRPFLSGGAVWVFNDFCSEFRGDYTPHFNNKGLVDVYRKPKDVYYFYQAQLTDVPVLHIAGKGFERRAGVSEKNDNTVVQKIKVYSNLAEAELFNNGISLGSKKFVNCTAEWPVTFVNGENRLSARGTKNSEVITATQNIEMTAYPAVIDPAFREVGINVGSTEFYADERSFFVWLPDKPYTPGGWGYTEDPASPSTQLILRTHFDGTYMHPVYQTGREGLTGYRFDVPEGTYEVELVFVHPWDNKAFSVLINDAEVFSYSISREKQVIITKKFIVQTNGKTGINIKFTSTQGSTLLNAVKVKRQI